MRSRAAKRTENASCNFMKLSSLSDENSTNQNKGQNQTITKYTTTANSDKNIEKPKPQKKSVKDIESIHRNSPHSKRSLHNRPPREIRNIIPELPTQNMPALPQNSSPLVRQHRSHNCNEKSRSHIQARTINAKLITKPLYRKYLRI